MKSILLGLTVLLAGWLLTAFAPSQSLQQTLTGIEQHIGQADAQGLSKYFNDYVEVTINEKDETYPKAQAVFIIKEFFAGNKAQSFHIVHQGSSNNNFYAIGEYKTSQGKFDANIFIKKVGNNYLIEQIRFEKEKK